MRFYLYSIAHTGRKVKVDGVDLDRYNMGMKANSKKLINLSVIIEKDDSGYFVGIVPSLRSCYTQAKTLPELYKRLQEVVALSLEVEKKLFKTDIKPNQFVGFQNMEFAS